MSNPKQTYGGAPDPGAPVLLELKDVTKRYPGVTALSHMHFQLLAGEVHVLFGENGAGKSTLISLVAGAQQPSEGEVLFKGAPVDLSSVHQARDLGISAVFQEFSLVNQLTVAENLFLGSEGMRHGLLDKAAQNRRARDILERLGFPIKATARVERLTRAEQQMVEIAKAFRADLSVLILDEPTASLTDRETEQLFALIEQVKSRGVGVIYITHRMSEIRRIGDRITVLRDGQYVATVDAQATHEDELVRMMTGKVIDQVFPEITFSPGRQVLGVESLNTASGSVRDACINIRAGEIVGFAGLVGSGKSELFRACFGLEEVSAGQVIFDGQDVTNSSPRQMLDRGFFYNPPDRRQEGLTMVRSCLENMSLPSLGLPGFSNGPFLRRGRERDTAGRLARQLGLYPMKVDRQVEHFSGGNQQKVLLAKCLTRDVDLYVFDEPTVGVDVGARVEIYRFIAKLCEEGAAVAVVSSDLPEVLHLSSRAYVFYRGRVQAELTAGEITQENILRHFFEREAA